MNAVEVEGKVVAITGASSGIGKGLALEAARRGAKAIILCDLDAEGGETVAQEIGDCAQFFKVDVTSQDDIDGMVATVLESVGPIDLYFSNAGIIFSDAPDWTFISQTDAQWDLIWKVNVHAHVVAARALLPSMIERGGCGFVITASAAGLLSQIGDTSYSTTKHAAVGMAESMAITHGDDGLYVGVLCPQAVESKMTANAGESSAALDGILTAEHVAGFTLDAVAAGHFMIRPHPNVHSYQQMKAADYDRWVGGMRKLRRGQMERTGTPV